MQAQADTLLTTEQAAAALKISRRRVRQLVASGRLPVTHVGRVLAIHPSDLAAVLIRPPGRPRRAILPPVPATD